MFGSLGMIAFLASLGLMCALYFISSSVRNSNHPVRGTYLMSEDTFSICAPGLFEGEHALTDTWRCGELQNCFLQQQNRALSCISWSSDHQMNISTVRHGMISDNSSMSVLCLLNEQVKLGRCVPSFGWNESNTDNTSSPSLYQCALVESEWTCHDTHNELAERVEIDYAPARTHLRGDSDMCHRKLQQESIDYSLASVDVSATLMARRHGARATRVDLYDHRESIRLLNILLNGKCDSFRACPGQV